VCGRPVEPDPAEFAGRYGAETPCSSGASSRKNVSPRAKERQFFAFTFSCDPREVALKTP